MSVNDTYTSAEAALSRAFRGTSALCAVDCACGRTYFVSAAGYGDFEPGELEGYKAKASIDPDKYVECVAFDHVDTVWIGGEELVVQCVCGKARRYLEFFEANRDALADFIAERLKDEIGELERRVEDARRRARSMDEWNRARSPEHFKGFGI